MKPYGQEVKKGHLDATIKENRHQATHIRPKYKRSFKVAARRIATQEINQQLRDMP